MNMKISVYLWGFFLFFFVIIYLFIYLFFFFFGGGGGGVLGGEIKFICLLEDRGHQGTYSPYKLFNHNLYIGIIIFPHIDNPQSTGYN